MSLSFIVRNIHAKFGQNPWSGSPDFELTDRLADKPTFRPLTSTTVVENNNYNPNLY